MVAMKLLLIITTCFALTFANDASGKFASSNTKFTSDVYRALAAESDTKEKNIVFSPSSLQIVLILTKEGAGGDTAKELANLLKLPNESYKGNIIDNFHRNISSDVLTLRWALKLYVATNFNVLPKFLNLANNIYRIDIEKIDFSNSDSASANLNEWVEERTEGIIKNLIDRNQIDGLTKFVLINALYFKGEWSIPFNPQRTRLAPFYSDSKTSNNIKMMNAVGNYLFYDSSELKAKFLELSYLKCNISMTFVLPHDITGLAIVESKLSKYLTRQNLKEKRVAVSIPMLNITTTVDFKPILKALGVHQLFEDSADLTGISSQNGLYVQFLNQKAVIGVSENGTEATAATAVVGGIRSLPVGPISELNFIANHPFLYYIRDAATGGILFIGRFLH